MKSVLGAAVAAAMVAAIVAPVAAQVPGTPVPPPPSAVPVPSDLELSKLVWSTMAAVDDANQAGNYSVLRDLAAPGFQVNNDAAKLTQVFATLRASRLDLSNTLLLAPTFTATPRFVQAGILQLKGFFGLRPTAVAFELYYQWVMGRWKLFGVSIAPAPIASQQPVSSQPRPAPSTRK